jgi:hypothetical protein
MTNQYDDLPALVKADGSQWWYRDGIQHRDGDHPAVIRRGGEERVWIKHGRPCRDGDQPAVVKDDMQIWYKNGRKGRDGDLPAKIWADGSQFWYRDGLLHREEDKPAFIYATGELEQRWYRNGLLHRDGGRPAIIANNERQQWWFEGYQISRSYAMKIADRQRERIEKCIRDRLVPRLYDPRTKSGRNRMSLAYIL